MKTTNNNLTAIQLSVLAFVKATPRRACEICKEIGKSQVRVSHILQALAKKGVVQQDKSGDHPVWEALVSTLPTKTAPAKVAPAKKAPAKKPVARKPVARKAAAGKSKSFAEAFSLPAGTEKTKKASKPATKKTPAKKAAKKAA